MDFNVTVNSVIDRLPVDMSQVTATTDPVSTVAIQDWIDEASAELTSLLHSKGFSEDTLPSTVRDMMKRAVRSYAASQALKAFGLIGNQYSEHMASYERIYEKYSQNQATGDRTRSRSTTRKVKSKYLDPNYKL